jgi:hypothetical protein
MKGEATGIPYQKDFEFYLGLLLHPDRRRWALDVIEFFNLGVIGTKSPTAQSADNPTGASSHVRSWEDELLSEIGNEFGPPTFPSRLPSEPLVSNPRPLSVATNTRAAATVVHEPGPGPDAHQPPLPGPDIAPEPLDSDLDAEPPVPSLAVPVNVARPRPRPLNRHINASPEDIAPSISVVPQVPVDARTMSDTSSNGQVTNTVITLSNAVNADLQLEVARLSINPDPELPESAPKSGCRARATTSSGSRSKIGAVAAYPVGGANELGGIAALPVAPVGRTTRSKKRAN